MKLKSLIILLIFLVPSILSAQDVLRINSIEEANNRIEEYIYVYEDTANALEFESIIDSTYTKQFIPLNKFSNKLSKKKPYWIRFTIINHIDEDTSVCIQFSYKNHLIEIYRLSDSLLVYQKTGAFTINKLNDEIFPFTNAIQIRNNVENTYYVKIKNITDKRPSFSLEIISAKKLIKDNLQFFTKQALLHGLLWLMIFFGIMMFILNREKLYLFYSLYIFLTSFWYLCHFGLLHIIFPGFPRTVWLYHDIFLLSAMILYISFALNFIDSLKIKIKWIKYLRLMQYFLAIYAIWLLAYMLLTRNQVVSVYLSFVISSIANIFIILFIIELFRCKNRLSFILAIGTTFLVLGTLEAVIQQAITYNEKAWLNQQIGVLIELLIFTFGIIYRHKLNERIKLKAKERLVEQLNLNYRFQEKAKEELEIKVKERTVEIVEKNEILKKQKEKITEQRDEVEDQRNFAIKQKEQIEIQNKSITDSIKYAKRIQSAILTPVSYINELLNENFIFYKPRDIVSGDFYWVKQVNQYIIIVAADCTGHGVPGAFMSMIGISYLNEIVQRREITQANMVLNELRSQIKHSLRQHGKIDESQDGLDMAMCVIDTKSKMMQYSGAYNPLYLIKDINGKPELKEIKADRMPVSFQYGKDKSFTNHDIQLEMGDTFYIFSDGFIDQIGGEDNKKYLSKNFKKLLLEIHTKPMYEQKVILDETLQNWMKGNSQVDDIIVIGVRM